MEPERFTTKALRQMVNEETLPEDDRERAFNELMRREVSLTGRTEGEVKRGFVDGD